MTTSQNSYDDDDLEFRQGMQSITAYFVGLEQPNNTPGGLMKKASIGPMEFGRQTQVNALGRENSPFKFKVSIAYEQVHHNTEDEMMDLPTKRINPSGEPSNPNMFKTHNPPALVKSYDVD